MFLSHIPYPISRRKGFTLIEMVLVLAVLSILAVVGFFTLLGFRGSADLDSSTDSIIELATEARGNAISGENFVPWGILVSNPTSSSSFAGLQRCNDGICASPTETKRIVLSRTVDFTQPIDGANDTITFNQRSGEVSDGKNHSIIICLIAYPQQCRTIVIYATGLIESRRDQWAISYDTNSTRILSFIFDSSNGVLYAGGGSYGIIYRCDTATKCDEPTDWTVAYVTTEDEIDSLAFDSAHGVLYAGSAPNGKIYRCDTATKCDEPTDWTIAYDTNETYILTFAFDSAHGVLYAGTGTNGIIYRCDTTVKPCSNGATDWTPVSNSVPGDNIYAFIFDSSNKVLYAGTYSGPASHGIIYRCDTATLCDQATDWTAAYTTTENQIDSLIFDSSNKVLYAGSGLNGIIYRCDTTVKPCSNGATDWTIAYDTPEGYIYSLAFDSSTGTLYAGTGNKAIIYRCLTATLCDAAADWTVSYDTPETNVYDLAVDGSTGVLYAGTSTRGIIYRRE